jgi:hypothetical protein
MLGIWFLGVFWFFFFFLVFFSVTLVFADLYEVELIFYSTELLS